MKLEWMILAEGFGTSANGAVTAIGVNQQLVVAPNLPTTTKRGVLAHFSTDNRGLEGQEVDVTLTVADPAGKTLITQTSAARVAFGPQWQDIPTGLDIFLEIPLRLSEYGSYEISLSLKRSADEFVTGRVPFYVKESPSPPGIGQSTP